MLTVFRTPEKPVQYRAIGIIRGIYSPLEERFGHGSITDFDDCTVKAKLEKSCYNYLGAQDRRNAKKFLPIAQLWCGHPRTDKETGELFFIVRGFIPPIQAADARFNNSGYHSVRGQLVFIKEGSFGIRIIPNKREEGEELPTWKPFVLQIQGALPGAKRLEFWELDCRLEDGRLWLKEANKVRPAPNHNKKKKFVGKDRNFSKPKNQDKDKAGSNTPIARPKPKPRQL